MIRPQNVFWEVCRALIAAATMALLPGHVLAAGGAFAVDDAEIGNPGSCKVETWTSFADNRDFAGNATPACVVDFIAPVELGAQFQSVRSEGGWTRSVSPKAKINIIPIETGKVGVGLFGGTNFDYRSGRRTGSFIAVPVTFAISEQFKVNVNGGWLHDRIDSRHWLTWGAGFKWNFVTPLTLIGEVYGQTRHKDPNRPSLSRPRAQLGLRYTAADSVDLDIIYGRSISGVSANWITGALNVRFDMPSSSTLAGKF